MLPDLLDDLPDRRVVWEALSDLFFDTDSVLFRKCRVKNLLQTAYTLDVIEQILVQEVYPILIWNLWSEAGVWDGFDMEDVELNIIQRHRSKFKYSF